MVVSFNRCFFLCLCSPQCFITQQNCFIRASRRLSQFSSKEKKLRAPHWVIVSQTSNFSALFLFLSLSLFLIYSKSIFVPDFNFSRTNEMKTWFVNDTWTNFEFGKHENLKWNILEHTYPFDDLYNYSKLSKVTLMPQFHLDWKKTPVKIRLEPLTSGFKHGFSLLPTTQILKSAGS